MGTPSGRDVVRARIDAALRTLGVEAALRRRGVVQSVGDGVASAAGLD